MKSWATGLAAATLLAASAGAATAIEVKKSVDVASEPAAVWEAIGGWCAINDWHPAIAECEEMEEGDLAKRVLTTGDGGKIFETRAGRGPMSYQYVITESPLPVENYKANLQVEKGESGGSKVSWNASFDPKGDAAEAEKAIAGIFESGLAEIKKMVEKK
jgi:hypothetical protein